MSPHIVIPDDYHDAVRGLRCFALLEGYRVTALREPLAGAALAAHLRDADALVLVRVGFVKRESYELYFEAAFNNLRAFFQGAPSHIANPGALAAH